MEDGRLDVNFSRDDVSESGVFSGYGNVFGVKDAHGSIVIPGAFSKSLESWKLKGRMPKMCNQHNHRGNPIGVWQEMREDSHGLYVKGKISDTAEGRDALTLIKDGALDQLSIGFMLPKGGMEMGEYNGQKAMLIKEVELWEVSVVTFASNQESRITSVKSLSTKREHEQFLRDAGYSRSMAKRMVSFLDCDDQDEMKLLEEQVEKAFNISRSLAHA